MNNVYFLLAVFRMGGLMYTVKDHRSSKHRRFGLFFILRGHLVEADLLPFLPVLQLSRNLEKGAEVQDLLLLLLRDRREKETRLISRECFRATDSLMGGNESLLGQLSVPIIGKKLGFRLILLLMLPSLIIKKRHVFLFPIY